MCNMNIFIAPVASQVSFDANYNERSHLQIRKKFNVDNFYEQLPCLCLMYYTHVAVSSNCTFLSKQSTAK